jgi:hypothetical protein
MEEHRHQATLDLGFYGLTSVPVLRMAFTSHDSFQLTGTVIAADRHSVGGWVAALVTACLALGFAAFCFA